MRTDGTREAHDTPCRGICSTTNVGGAICKGCGRTAEEVIYWNTYSKERKIEVNRRLKNEKVLD